MRQCFLLMTVLSIVGIHAIPADAKTFYPMIANTSPAAVVAGGSVDCDVFAEHGWYAPTQVLITGESVMGEVLPPDLKLGGQPPAPGRATIKVRFAAAADALGIRDFRIMTSRGPSTLGQLVVVRSPLVREDAENNSVAKSQTISLPATVCGVIEANEDVDVFRIQIAEPTSWLFHMHCQRLLHKLGPMAYHSDPMLTLRNAAGTILASNDNFFGSDPFLAHRFDKAGDYYIEIRDVRYVGYRHWHYTLEIHDRPLVRQALPAVIPAGHTFASRLIGYQLPNGSAMSLGFPAETPPGIQWIDPGSIAGKPSEPRVPVLVTQLPLVAETLVANDGGETSQKITLPAGISGLVERPDDLDTFAFEARKGDRLTFKVTARTLGSPLDANLRVLNEQGDVLIENDDATDKTGNADCRNEITTPDSRIADWTAPNDGQFRVEIRDTHLRGGENFAYFLEVRPRQPGLHLEIDTDKTVLAPGITVPVFIRAFREEGLTGPIRLSVNDLPPGVTAVCGEIPADGQDACIFLTAADDTPVGGCSNMRVVGEAIDPEHPETLIVATAVPFQELRRDGGARYMVPVEMHTVGVADALDLKHVRCSETKLALKPGDKRTVQISFERTPGFTDPVTLTAIHSQHVWVFGRCLPQGVTVDERESKLRLTDKEVEGTIVLSVAKDAIPASPRLTPLIANVAVNFSLKMMYSGEPVEIRIDGP